jgi:glutamate dehydrogenase
MRSVLESNGPVLKVVEGKRGEKRLVVGYLRRTTKCFFSAFSDVFHYYGLNTVRKHVDQFSNGNHLNLFRRDNHVFLPCLF